MKIWQSYGAEHSLDLVIIGRFKEVVDAEEFKQQLDSLIEFLNQQSDHDINADRFSPEVSSFLAQNNLYCFSPQQLSQFLYEMDIDLNKKEIRITSDDDLNALITLLIHKSAKVEVFSAHDYPEAR